MTFPKNISRVVVQLESGQWVSLTREDLEAVEAFCLPSQFWSLLVFIAGLQQIPREDTENAGAD
jgi:hypothetical protein